MITPRISRFLTPDDRRQQDVPHQIRPLFVLVDDVAGLPVTTVKLSEQIANSTVLNDAVPLTRRYTRPPNPFGVAPTF